MIAKDIKIMYGSKDMEITLTLNKDKGIIQDMTDLKKVTEGNGMLDVKIKKYRKKRSLDANAYCWIIADKIAKVIGNTKEFVYKEAIKAVGEFEIIPIRDEAVDKWIRNWNSKGVGWQSEIYPGSLLEGYTRTINYYGSSTYDSKEMSILLEEIVFLAKELGIDTISKEEQDRLSNMIK